MEINRIKQIILMAQNITAREYLQKNDIDATQVVNIYTQKLLDALDRESPKIQIFPSNYIEPIKVGDYVTTDFTEPRLSYYSLEGARKLKNLYRVVKVEDDPAEWKVSLRVLRSETEITGTLVYNTDYTIRKIGLSNGAILFFDKFKRWED